MIGTDLQLEQQIDQKVNRFSEYVLSCNYNVNLGCSDPCMVTVSDCGSPPARTDLNVLHAQIEKRVDGFEAFMTSCNLTSEDHCAIPCILSRLACPDFG